MILIPVVLQRKFAVRALRRRYQFRHQHHRTRPVLQSSTGERHYVSSLTDDHRPDGDAPHEDGPETGSDPGVMRWCTRPSTGLPRTARASDKVARLRQAAQNVATRFRRMHWRSHGQLDEGGGRCTHSD